MILTPHVLLHYKKVCNGLRNKNRLMSALFCVSSAQSA